jgi:anaerobic magnesium-protoporphyrin IX monomethyl ester cyclase
MTYVPLRPAKVVSSDRCALRPGVKTDSRLVGTQDLSRENSVTTSRHILLINPTITSRRSARFPLAVMSLAAALEPFCDSTIVDGNIDRAFVATALRRIAEQRIEVVGVTVMGGPQLPSAINVSRAIKARYPWVVIVWGGYFPTLCPLASMNAPYVDYVVRGQGEVAFAELLRAHFAQDAGGLDSVAGLSWRREGQIVHNPPRTYSPAPAAVPLSWRQLDNPRDYLGRTYLGRSTVGYQAALGCRFRCTFCGVAAMFHGKTTLPPAERLEHDLRLLTRELGVDAINFYDHNFFDREVDMVPLLEVLAKYALPWWCFARADALLNLSERSWELVRRSGLRMAYIGAETPSDWLLHEIRKGTRAEQTLEVVRLCRAHGVVPELSFMLAPPHDAEGETERTFEFIRSIKRLHEPTEIMLYVYTPLPPAQDREDPHRNRAALALCGPNGAPLQFPTTAEEWAQPSWLEYWCHANAPWVTDRLRQRIRDFTTVLGCRFPTATDVHSPRWARSTLRTLASWRYRYRRYHRPWELELSKRFIRQLHDPRVSGL